jgi:hypothetical protein
LGREGGSVSRRRRRMKREDVRRNKVSPRSLQIRHMGAQESMGTND